MLALTVTGCTGEDQTERPAPTATPLAELDLGGVAVPRTSFCDAIDDAAVAEALGGEPASTRSYGPGDPVEVAPGTTEVAHEFGCTFRRGPFTARAWVFAQPVTATQARRWARGLAEDGRCRPTGPLEFGRPGVVVECVDRSTTAVRMAGLFGDAWLTCEVARRTGRTTADRHPERAAAEAAERAQRWCASVALAAA